MTIKSYNLLSFSILAIGYFLGPCFSGGAGDFGALGGTTLLGPSEAKTEKVAPVTYDSRTGVNVNITGSHPKDGALNVFVTARTDADDFDVTSAGKNMNAIEPAVGVRFELDF